jgi:Calcineurin-like phosphoesterase
MNAWPLYADRLGWSANTTMMGSATTTTSIELVATTARTTNTSSSTSSTAHYTAIGRSNHRQHAGNILDSTRCRERRGAVVLGGGLAIAMFLVVWISIPTAILDTYNTWYQPRLLLQKNHDDDDGAGVLTFRILQLTDLHLGEAPYEDWGPEQDVKTFRLIRDLLSFEHDMDDDENGNAHIDLVIFSGDQLTGNNVDGNATVYYDRLGDLMDEMKLPYAMIFGNHDDMDFIANYPDGLIAQHPARTLRHALAVSDRRHRQSLTPLGPVDIFGVSNGILSVYHPIDGSLVLQVVLLDSGGGSLAQQIVANQLDWYQSQRQLNIPAIAFQHIPTDQFQYGGENTSSVCAGYNGENGIAPLDNDPTGEISRLAQIDTKLLVLAVGHNHGNSYCCEQQQPTTVLCFGRHSGYGGYGTWDRGARVYTFSWDDSTTLRSWHTYVRLQYGNTTDTYQPVSTM